MFYSESAKNDYIFDHSQTLDWQGVRELGINPTGKRTVVYVPFECDSEFQTSNPEFDQLIENRGKGSITITTQLKTVHGEDTAAKIYNHPDLRDTGITCSYPVFRSGFAPIDYLQSFGVPITLQRVNSKDRKWYNLVILCVRTFCGR